MVPSRASDDALPSLFLAEMGHLVVGTSQLEGEYREQVFSFEKDLRLKTVADIDSVSEGCLLHHIVNFCSCDQADILFSSLVTLSEVRNNLTYIGEAIWEKKMLWNNRVPCSILDQRVRIFGRGFRRVLSQGQAVALCFAQRCR